MHTGVTMDSDLTEQVFKLFKISIPAYKKFPRIKRKKNGQKKVRWIYAPADDLKRIQHSILRSVLYKYAPHPCAHAYVAQKNIRSGAFCHAKYDYTIVLDIKQFFPSITQEQVRKALGFYTEKDYNVDPADFFYFEAGLVGNPAFDKIPKNLSSLDLVVGFCTYEGVLPQGAPTSGAISNIVMYPLDTLFEQICSEKNFAYSRYADDLTFSGNSLDELKKFVFGYVFKKIREAGFEINKKKVHVFQKEHRLITGLNVHKEGVRPARKYRRKLRARLANLRRDFQECENLEEIMLVLKQNHNLNPVLGHLMYVAYTDTYSEAVAKMICDYIIPIADHVGKFVDGFSQISCKQFGKNLQDKRVEYRYNDVFMKLHKEIRKLRVTGISEKHKNFVEKPTNTKYALHVATTSVDCTYRERRALVHHAIFNPDPVSFLRSLTLASFQKGYRFAGPEDKLHFLVKTIQSRIQTRGIWYKVCTYAARLPYVDRLLVLRAIATSPSFLKGNSPGEQIALKMSLRKILRGLNVMDLSEFVTSDNPSLRLAAQDLIQYRNRVKINQEEG